MHLIDEPVAAAIGAGLPVTDPVGAMIVDIGGGTTEVAVLSLGGTVLSESVRVAGDELSDAISVYLKKVHNLVVGQRTAEDIKIRIGSAFPQRRHQHETSMDVRGLHLLSGLPRTINIRAGDIRGAMAEPLNVVVEAVKRTLERTPPELAAESSTAASCSPAVAPWSRGFSILISHENWIHPMQPRTPCSAWSTAAAWSWRTTADSSACSTPPTSPVRRPDPHAGMALAPRRRWHLPATPGSLAAGAAGPGGGAAQQGGDARRCLRPSEPPLLWPGTAESDRLARPGAWRTGARLAQLKRDNQRLRTLLELQKENPDRVTARW